MAVAFNAIGSQIRYTSDPPDLSGATEMSAAVTLRTRATLNDGYIASVWNFFTHGQQFTLVARGNELAVYVFGTGGYKARITTSGPLSPTTVHRICWTWTAAGVFSIVVDGVDCPVAVHDGHDSAVTALSTPLEQFTLGLINIPGVGEEAVIADYAEVALWSSDIGLPARQAITTPVETETTPAAAVAYTSGLIFYAPLCRSLHPTGAFPDPNISDIVGGSASLLFILDSYPDANAEHPWVAYPEGSPYEAGFCPVTAPLVASCSGGQLPVSVDPGDGDEFEGLGPHEDRLFIETDLDDGTERWALQTAMRDHPDLAAHPDYKQGRITTIGSLIRRTTGRLGAWQSSSCRWSTDDHDRLVRGFLATQHWYGREFRVYLAKRDNVAGARILGRFFVNQPTPTHPFSVDIEGLDIIGSEFSPLALQRDILSGFTFDSARFPQAPQQLTSQDPPQPVPVYMGRWSDEGSDGPPPVLAGSEARGSHLPDESGADRFHLGFANQPAGSPLPPDSVSGSAVSGGSIPLGRTPYNLVYAMVWAVTGDVEGDPLPFYPELLEIAITANNQQIEIDWTFAGTDPDFWRIGLAVKYFGARWNQVLEVVGTERTASFTNIAWNGQGASTPGASAPYINRKEFSVLAVMADGRTTVCNPTGIHPYGGPYQRKPYLSWLPIDDALSYEVYTAEVPVQYFGWSQRFVVSADAIDADGYVFFEYDWNIAGALVEGLPIPLGMLPVFESGLETIDGTQYVRYAVARWPFHLWLGIRAGGRQIKDNVEVLHPDGTWPFAERYRLIADWACSVFYVRNDSLIVEKHRDGTEVLQVNACTTEDVGDGTGSTISHSPRAVRFLWERLVIQDAKGVDWGASPTFDDGVPMVRGSDYEAAELMQIARVGGEGYAARIALIDPITVGQFSEFVVQSYGLHHGIGWHGQIRAGHYDDAVDTTVGYPHFTHINAIKGPIAIKPLVTDYENAIPYQWDFRPVTRTYLVRKVAPADQLTDDDSIARNFGKRRTGPLRSSPYAADAGTVADVMQRNLLLGRFVNEWVEVPTDLRGQSIDLFSIIQVSDPEGTGGTGYVEEYVLVLEHEVVPGDPERQKPTVVILKGLNITKLIDGAWVWGPDSLTTWDAMTSEQQGVYGAWASDADVIPTANDPAKEWR